MISPRRSTPSSPHSSVAENAQNKMKRDKSVRRERIAADHVNVQKVERFLLQCYHYLAKHEGLGSLLENPSALTKFNEYLAPQALTSGCATGLHFWVLAGELLEAEGAEERRTRLKVLEETFCDESGRFNLTLAHKCLTKLHESTARLRSLDADTDSTEVAEALQAVLLAVKEAHTEILHMMAANNYSSFLQSKQYTCWRSQERGYAVAVALSRTIEPGEQAESSVISSAGKAAMNGEQPTAASDSLLSSPVSESYKPRRFFGGRSSDNSMSRTLSSPSVAAYTTVEMDRLNRLVAGDSQWLVILMAAAETLPVSFSLHAAAMSTTGSAMSKSGRGKALQPADPVVFPCVYFNEHYRQSVGLPRRQLLGRAMGHNVSCASTLNELLVLLLVLGRDTDASTITLSNGTTIKPTPGGGPASIKATQVSKWMGMQRSNYTKTPFVAATDQQLRAFVETLREGTAAMVNVQLVREDDRVREVASSFLSTVTELHGNRRDSDVMLSPGSRSAPALGKLGGIISNISAALGGGEKGEVEKDNDEREGDGKAVGGSFTASIKDMLRAVSGSKASMKVSGVDKEDSDRLARINSQHQKEKDVASASDMSSASQTMYVHRNVIMGVKPVLAKDRCTVLYYIVLQLEPVLITDCFRERHQMETLLGLLPDVFPLRAAEDEEQSISDERNNGEVQNTMPGGVQSDSHPTRSSLQSAVSYASFFTRVRSFMLGAPQVAPSDGQRHMQGQGQRQGEGPQGGTPQETPPGADERPSSKKLSTQQRKTDAGCSPAAASASASTPVLVRRKTVPSELDAKPSSNQTASSPAAQRPMYLPNYDCSPTAGAANTPSRGASSPMHLPNYGSESGARRTVDVPPTASTSTSASAASSADNTASILQSNSIKSVLP